MRAGWWPSRRLQYNPPGGKWCKINSRWRKRYCGRNFPCRLGGRECLLESSRFPTPYVPAKANPVRHRSRKTVHTEGTEAAHRGYGESPRVFSVFSVAASFFLRELCVKRLKVFLPQPYVHDMTGGCRLTRASARHFRGKAVLRPSGEAHRSRLPRTPYRGSLQDCWWEGLFTIVIGRPACCWLAINAGKARVSSQMALWFCRISNSLPEKQAVTANDASIEKFAICASRRCTIRPREAQQ
jgi:hypothetical protein